MPASPAHKLPRSGPGRETLREKGQFWTPDWIADAMAAYVLQDKPPRLLDPATGQGAFFRAAKRFVESCAFSLELRGCDVDPAAIAQAADSGLSPRDLRHVELRDFVLDPPPGHFPAIIANPPYIRHHRLPAAQKRRLQKFALEATGRHIDGRAGLHVYFLIRALQCLAPGGRLAYIVSADICEGVFAPALWSWISSRYRLDAVIAFAPQATPFPDIDTNALVFLIRNTKPAANFNWIKCLDAAPAGLVSLVTGQKQKPRSGIEVHRRSLSEALATGLSRPHTAAPVCRFTLGDFARVKRGIATGANDFFFMTSARARELKIPAGFLVKAVGRMRDVRGDSFSAADLRRLEAAGRPTRLLNVNGTPFDQLPPSVRAYLGEGEKSGVPQKTLIKTRKPWHRMESRAVPPILFAYLGRRSARFIRNRAGVVPLTCLLCVYPKGNAPEFVEHLWNILSHPETIANLKMVGKSYGGGAIKVEPRALERLPLPDSLVRAAKLSS